MGNAEQAVRNYKEKQWTRVSPAMRAFSHVKSYVGAVGISLMVLGLSTVVSPSWGIIAAFTTLSCVVYVGGFIFFKLAALTETSRTIQQTVNDVCERTGLQQPTITTPDGHLGGMQQFGPFRGVLLYEPTQLMTLSSEERGAVIAHELAHTHQRYERRLLIALLSIVGPAIVGTYSLPLGVLGAVVFPIIRKQDNQRMEYAADRVAGETYGSVVTAVAIARVAYGYDPYEETGLSLRIARLLSSHPPIRDRIARLEEQDDTPRESYTTNTHTLLGEEEEIDAHLPFQF